MLKQPCSRAPWGDQINSSSSKLESILAAGLLSGQYVNVANQLGMSNVRGMYAPMKINTYVNRPCHCAEPLLIAPAL
jgi:hypothetical protein